MLDSETRRRIDTARDILVGKVPDPKSQVEQITIALIYKFMDDMDKEAIDFGGKASFFTGEYEKYGWSKIFDPRLGGYEMLSLYGEAIEKLDQNPNIPQLFRDIFKNAYLPYRDPETLKLFLKTINEFTYDHSEKLGDAFEYLLSVLGSQGHAGQFRTPRHIIDFIVDILQPKKNETILDPACGTAGFLISSYKYMLKENTNKTKGDLLTPSDRKKIMNNFTGYDISPDMVRLSLVNMYLHHFTSPKIYEYDTLTSEDRWGDYFDIIMANPPFMTPKGGIKPHKKFTMQANRSEVLFVDYIAEHINPTTGRAGVIVPEGIIFQSATAYKALRKLLVDKNYLYAVVSLPAGIFNPYSGVKTSVLLMDKTIAKKTDKILFVKIENDGFDLGAQRKVIAKNDLTDSLEVINNYQLKIKNDKAVEELSGNYLLVEKEKIKTNGDYNLSIDRYRVNGNKRQLKYETVRLADICKNLDSKRKPVTESDRTKGIYPYYGASGIVDYVDNYIFDGEYLLVSEDGANLKARVTPIAFSVKGKIWVNNHAHVLQFENRFQQRFVELYLENTDISQYITGAAQPKLNQEALNNIPIPFPPLSIQQEIVNKIEGWQKIIDGAKQIIENYKPQIDINPDWEMVKLGDVCEINPKKSEVKDLPNNTLVSFVPMQIIQENKIVFIPQEVKKISEVYTGYTYFKIDDVILAKVTPCFENGKSGIAGINLKNGIGFGSSEFYVLRASEKILPEWIYYHISSDKFKSIGKNNMTGTGGLQRLTREFVLNYEIPLPSVEMQEKIIEELQNERTKISINNSIIKLFEQKIKDEINKLWQTDTKEYTAEEEPLSLVAED